MKYGMNLLLWTGEISDGLLPVSARWISIGVTKMF